MGGSSGGGNTTTTTKSDPWSGQQPYLAGWDQGNGQLTGGIFQAAQANYNSGGPQYYNGSTVADQSQATKDAYAATTTAANSPLQGDASTQVANTLNGNYLNGNPYLDAQFQAGTRQIGNTYNALVGGQTSGAEAGGRYGSGMQAFQKNQADQTLGDNLNNLYANTYGANYTAERQNQVNAVGQATGVQTQGLANANALGTVGSAQDAYNQSLTDASVNKWNYNQNLPNNNLAQYMGLIQGNYGGSASTTTPLSGQSLLGNLLGAGALGLGAYGATK
jgi:hypothetical protein